MQYSGKSRHKIVSQNYIGNTIDTEWRYVEMRWPEIVIFLFFIFRIFYVVKNIIYESPRLGPNITCFFGSKIRVKNSCEQRKYTYFACHPCRLRDHNIWQISVKSHIFMNVFARFLKIKLWYLFGKQKYDKKSSKIQSFST